MCAPCAALTQSLHCLPVAVDALCTCRVQNSAKKRILPPRMVVLMALCACRFNGVMTSSSICASALALLLPAPSFGDVCQAQHTCLFACLRSHREVARVGCAMCTVAATWPYVHPESMPNYVCRPERVVPSWFGSYSLLARHASSSLVMRLPRSEAHTIMHMLLDNPACPLVRGRADKV